MKNFLPYLTENGHEFFIKWENKIAHVTCHNDADITDNLSNKDIDCIIESAMVMGIEKVVLNTDYGVDIHTHSLKTNAKYKDFKLNKLVTEW